MTKLRQLLERCVPQKANAEQMALEKGWIDDEPLAWDTCVQTVLNNIPNVQAEFLALIDEMKYAPRMCKTPEGAIVDRTTDAEKAYNQALEDLKTKLTAQHETQSIR